MVLPVVKFEENVPCRAQDQWEVKEGEWPLLCSRGRNEKKRKRREKKRTIFLSVGPISDPASDVGNVFNDLLGLNLPNLSYHLCK